MLFPGFELIEVFVLDSTWTRSYLSRLSTSILYTIYLGVVIFWSNNNIVTSDARGVGVHTTMIVIALLLEQRFPSHILADQPDNLHCKWQLNGIQLLTNIALCLLVNTYQHSLGKSNPKGAACCLFWLADMSIEY